MDLIYRYDPFQPIVAPSFPDAESVIAALRNGNTRYTEIVDRMQKRTQGAAAGEPIIIPISPVSLGLPLIPGVTPQHAPFALILGCADARVPPESIFDQAFNDLFVIRIAGNVLGAECLGSVDYAVRHLGSSLRLLVVLGHTGCGAITAAVDAYLAPNEYGDIAYTHTLRSLLDRIQISVRGASRALLQACGVDVVQHPGYRTALIEMSVYINAAVTAFDVQREIRTTGYTEQQVTYSVYDMTTLRVHALPPGAEGSTAETLFVAPAPVQGDDFVTLSRQLAQRMIDRGVIH